ncbi:MAG: protein kinase [Phycisphaerae bacterium]|nr:protein kinase [Phycisphaerae bacterium]
MPITTICPSCGKQFTVSSKYVGRSGRCKTCNAKFTVSEGKGRLIEAGSKPEPEAETPAAARQSAAASSDDEKPDFNSLLAQGVSLFELQRYDEAAQVFKEATFLQPKSARAWINLGFTSLCRDKVSVDHFTECFGKAIAAGYSHGTPDPFRTPAVGNLTGHFMSLWDVRFDFERRLVWISGDTGVAFAPGKERYAPYDFRGRMVPRSRIAGLRQPHEWFQYGDSDRFPDFLIVQDPSELGIQAALKPAPALPSAPHRVEPTAEADQTMPERSQPVSAKDEGLTEWNEGDVILDLYEVKGLLGEGGMGKVHRVHHRGWDMDLAVKSPKASLFEDQTHKENFVRECETWIDLGLHPNTVSCYYVRTVDGIPRVFTELVEGGSLLDWIEERRLYEGGSEEILKRLLDVSIQFAWGLHYAHEKGLVHQDVKPANVLMTSEGVAKVTDFGLANARARAGESATVESHGQTMVVPGAGLCTRAYASPEQVAGEPLTRRTDIWSWGVSILELFAGERMWMIGEAAAQALEDYLDRGTEDASIPKMPEPLADLLRQCFRRSPDERPKDMQEIVAGLSEIYRQTTGRSYERQEPEAVEALADSLNNRAISLLDLGKQEEAAKLFDQALKADPHHPEATYNRGLLLWRLGHMTDDELVRQLEDVRASHPDDWRDEHLLGLVHIERGDAESATALLEEAARQAEDNIEVQQALAVARASGNEWGRCVRTLKGHAGSVTCVAISPDGRWVLSGSSGGTLRLWDWDTGACLRVLKGHTRWVSSVAISPNAKIGLSGCEGGTVRIWDLTTGKCLSTLEAHKSKVVFAASGDGRHVLSIGSLGDLRLWEAATGRCVQTFANDGIGVDALAVSLDVRLAISGIGYQRANLWDLSTGRSTPFIQCNGAAVSFALHPDSRSVLIAEDSRLKLTDLETGNAVLRYWGHTRAITSVRVTPDGCRALSSSEDSTLRLWDLASGRCLRTFQQHSSSVLSVAVSSDGRRAVTGSNDRTVCCWDIAAGVPQRFAACLPRSPFELGRNASEAQDLARQAHALLKEQRITEALNSARRLRGIPEFERNDDVLDLWNAIGLRCSHGDFLGAWEVPARPWVPPTFVAASPDCRLGLFVGARTNNLNLWDLATGQWLRELEGNDQRAEFAVISADGRFALSGGGWKNRALDLWDLASGRSLTVLKGHTGRVCCAAISPDGRLALSGGEDRSVRLWDLASGRLIGSFKGHLKQVTCVAIGPDGRWGLSASEDTTLRLWDFAKKGALQTLRGHRGGVNTVAVSSDGRWALSGSEDKTLGLWNLSTGQRERTLEGHASAVHSVAISPDGRWGLSGQYRAASTSTPSIRLWDLATGKCIQALGSPAMELRFVAFGDGNRRVFSMSGHDHCEMHSWELDRDHNFPGWSDWDAGASPHLESFVTLHCPYGEDGFTRVGKPQWTDGDFEQLIRQLQQAGYGWLGPEGVKKKLEEMAASWQEARPDIPSAVVGEGPTERGEDHSEAQKHIARLLCALGASKDPDPGRLRRCLEKLPGYVVEQHLSESCFSGVYVARRKTDGRDVVLELVADGVPGNDYVHFRQRRAGLLQRLQHPNIVALFESGKIDDIFFFVHEHCNGGSVADLMERQGGRSSLEEAGPIVLDVLAGMSYAHERGIVHRDIRPMNVLLHGSPVKWTAKVTGFHPVLDYERDGFNTDTVTEPVPGAPVFMPREQVTNFKYVKPVTDVWSMGATFYNMLTGQYPRDMGRGQDPMEVILNGKIVPVRKRDSSIPKKVAAVIDRALDNDVKARYQSAGEMRVALVKAL